MAAATHEIAGLSLRPLHEHIGAEVVGVDAAEADADLGRALRAALLDQPLLLLRGAPLSPERLVAFTRTLGEPLRHPPHPAHPELPEIAPISNDVQAGRLTRPYWHTDGLLRPDPPAVTVFHAVEVAPAGGDTVFIDARAALDALEPEDREALEGLRAVFGTGTEWPLVYAHPATGRKALMANLGATVGIVGLTRESAQGVLVEVSRLYDRPDWVYRHSYRPGDTLIWDNRAVAHSATEAPPPGSRRLMLRADVRE